MPGSLALRTRANEGDPGRTKFTSQTIIRTLEENKNESRRNRMLWLFKETDENKKVSYQFWQPDNHPELCY